MPARAIELSLEENRAERGSVGFVDMQRLFKSSPDATRAREGLEELVRQAEERVNGRKSELLRLRGELAALKAERDEVARSTPTPTVPVKTVPPAATQKKPEEPKKVEALAPSSATNAIAKPVEQPKPVETPKPVTADAPLTTPGAKSPMAPTPVTATAPAEKPKESAPLTINLPGLTDGPMVLERPGASPLNPTRDRVAEEKKAAVEAAKAPETPKPVEAPKPEIKPEAVVEKKPEPEPEPVLPVAGPTIAQRLLELDGQIVAKQADIDRVQAELDKERAGAEKTLLDAEGRKTDQVLARLYRAISEVAKREGVSVVVDKASTLYGHPAVDLTDKILKQLRGAAPVQ